MSVHFISDLKVGVFVALWVPYVMNMQLRLVSDIMINYVITI